MKQENHTMNISKLDDLMIVNIFQKCTKQANELNAVNLAQGVPEPLWDKEINQILTTATNTGWQYTNTNGLDTLRIALAQEYNNAFSPEEILVTSGCTESLYLGLLAAGNVYGNKVAFFEPFYPYYLGLAQLLNLEAIPIAMDITNSSITPDWNKVEHVIASGVRIFILNTPHNPSGWVMNIHEAALLRTLTDKYGVLLIIDEAYRYYTYTDTEANAAIEILYNKNQHVLLAGSASKLFSATGLRIGWLLGRANILSIAYAAHLYTTYCHPAPLQQMTATLFNQRQANWFHDIKTHYINKRDKLLNALNNMGFQCTTVAGGHFLLADYSNLCNDMDSANFADYFVVKYGIMPLPVNPFYRKNHIPHQVRFSFSVTMDTINNAISCIT